MDAEGQDTIEETNYQASPGIIYDGWPDDCMKNAVFHSKIGIRTIWIKVSPD
jgi:hypothetical protein